MSSINLSFKEWPFPSLSEASPDESLIASPLREKNTKDSKTKLSLNLPQKYNHSLYTSNLDLSRARSLEKPNIKLNKIEQIPLQTRKQNKAKHYQLSAWGRCGLFACTYGSNLSIFSNDNSGCLSPMFMFSPFDHFNKNKLTKKSSESTSITAIGWVNGSLQPSIPKPIFAVASEKGNIAIYDFSTKEVIGHLRLGEKIISILWSSFKLNRLYMGSNSGHFYICEINNKCIEIKQTFDFNSFSTDNSESVSKSVDFITEDNVDGHTVAIASKDGSVGYITKSNEIKKPKLQVFQQLPFNSCLRSNIKSKTTINFFEFYPNDQNFVIIATNKSTFLFSTQKGVLIPFIQTFNCNFITINENSNNQVIIGDGKGISLWSLINNLWVRSSVIIFTGNLYVTEILTYSKLNNKILVTTASNWLTEVECRRNKIFITKRVKLMSNIPIDYDFGNGSIAFLTDDNSVSFTSLTPESVIKPKFDFNSELRNNDQKTNYKKEDSSNNTSQLFHAVEDPSNDGEEEELAVDATLEEPLTNENKENIANSFVKSNSMTFTIGSDSSRAFRHIFDHKINDSLIVSDVNAPIPRSKSDLLSDNQEKNDFYLRNMKNNDNEMCGNSNSFDLSFNIKSDSPIKNIFWISPQKVIAFSQNTLFVIDLLSKTIIEPLKEIYDRKCNIITQVFFSKSRKLMCMILNHKTAFIINVEPNLKVINTIYFSEIIKKDYDNIYGSISPKEDQVVFASKNFLFFSKLNEASLNVKEVFINLDYNASFVSWENRGIILGTENGSVFIILKKAIDDIYNNSEINKSDCTIIQDSTKLEKKSGSIKLASPCANNSFLIVDSNNQGTIISGDVQQKINGEIDTIKLCNKDTFLARFKNVSKLIAIDAIGEFSPCPPPCFFLNQKNNEKINLLESKKEKNEDMSSLDSIVRHLFKTNQENPSKILRNTVQLLNQITSYHTPFNSLSLKNSLILGELEIARNVLLKTDPCDKNYLNNMMLAALFDTNMNNSIQENDIQNESTQLAVKSLMSNNKINEAVNILLITKKGFTAAELLYNFGRSKDAYQVLMLGIHDQSDHENVRELAQKVANSLISKKENILFGLKLMTSFGYISEVINFLSNNLL